MSDWGAQHTTLGSALGGLDMAMPGDGGPASYRAWWGGALTEAVLRGDVPQWRLDDMAVRIMTAYFKVHTGNYTSRPDINFSAWTNQTVGPLYPAANQSFTVVNEHVDVQSDHASLIREIGAKSIVLLKNQEGLLPLNKPATLAIVGDDARDHPLGPNACPERGCLNGTLAMGYGSGTAEFPYLVSPLTALQLQVQADNTTLIKAVTSNWDLDAARAAAAAADVAIVFAAATAGENFITIDGNAGDRNNLTLWANGDALIRAVAGVNPNTVVVLHTPGPVIIDYAEQHPNVSAILWAGLPGQESGNALVDVLYGRVNPQGRTPFSWGKSVEDYGAQLLFRAENPRAPTQAFDESVFIDYRWFVKQGMRPTYPFGFGLSYTRFQYSGLSVQLREGARARYEAATGETGPAPTLGVVEPELERHTAPEGFSRISPYVYPWLNNSVSLVSNSTAAGQFPPAAKNGSSQPVLPASGAPGGNPGLFEVMYTATVTIKNVGKVAGTEIPQLVSSPSRPLLGVHR
jgi:beta-glucosidase